MDSYPLVVEQQRGQMNPRERRALRRIERTQEQIDKLHQRIEKIRAAFRNDCTHSETTIFRWEHDNGYGRQSMQEGLQCLLCRKRKHWASSVHWS